jgi:hypothetical protein
MLLMRKPMYLVREQRFHTSIEKFFGRNLMLLVTILMFPVKKLKRSLNAQKKLLKHLKWMKIKHRQLL